MTDSALISTLNSAAGTLPSSLDSQAWNDYGYYISSMVSSYMWYIDLVSGSHTYRGVYFTSYRPEDTINSSSSATSYQDENGYYTSTVYWFKYEPISRRVLDVQTDKAFLVADLVLDAQEYYFSNATRYIGGATVYANNYMESHIRSWLNTSFHHTAFSIEDKARIQTTVVDNSVVSTGYSPNEFACANTADKVFALSYTQATSASYGFTSDATRTMLPSAYAKSQGAYTNSLGFAYWWMRSPNYYYDYYARDVDYAGYTWSRSIIRLTRHGVGPALWISL